MKKIMVHLNNKTNDIIPFLQQNGTVLANYGNTVLARIDEKYIPDLNQRKIEFSEVPTQSLVRAGALLVDVSNAGVETKSARFSVASATATNPVSVTRILTLAGPMHAQWKAELQENHVTINEILDENSYKVEIPEDKLSFVKDLPYVEFAPIRFPAESKINSALITDKLISTTAPQNGLKVLNSPEFKMGNINNFIPFKSTRPRTRFHTRQQGNIEVVAKPGTISDKFIDALENAGAEIIKIGESRVVAFAPSEDTLLQIANIEEVKEINPHSNYKFHNNVARNIIRVDAPVITTNNLDGSGQVIAICDTGLDTGRNDDTLSEDFKGRIVKIVALGRQGDASDLSGHGTHVAGSALGSGANSNNHIPGIAPKARLYFQSVLTADLSLNLPFDLKELYAPAREQGANFHSNSWGEVEGNGIYNKASADTDEFMFLNRDFLILFAAGNAGNERKNQVSPPGTAKNVLTVGASKSLRMLPAKVSFSPSPVFPSGITIVAIEHEADNPNQLTDFTSRGPVQNNRRKPDVVAPGSWILSSRSSVCLGDSGFDGLPETQDEDSNFTHEEAVGRGLPGGPVFGAGDENTPPLPAGVAPGSEQLYMYDSGTSMSTPIVTGACALLRQFLTQQLKHQPSAALIKALIVNGAVDMGMGVPHTGQGWGRVNISNSLFAGNTLTFDDSLLNAITTGETRKYQVSVASSNQPFETTLVWRDAPGAAIQNRLHLRVTHIATGNTLMSDSIHQIRNNVQKVIFKNPFQGDYIIEVEAVNITVGIPEFPGQLKQDYALVTSNVNALKTV